MIKKSELHFDASGNTAAKAVFAFDETLSEWDFVKAYEKTLFGYFRGEFSSIADNFSGRIFPKRKKRSRPPTIYVTIRRIKLKKTYLIESVSCDIGAKNLYKSRVIHVFRQIGGKSVYCGTRKKAIAENPKSGSNI